MAAAAAAAAAVIKDQQEMRIGLKCIQCDNGEGVRANIKRAHGHAPKITWHQPNKSWTFLFDVKHAHMGLVIFGACPSRLETYHLSTFRPPVCFASETFGPCKKMASKNCVLKTFGLKFGLPRPCHLLFRRPLLFSSLNFLALEKIGLQNLVSCSSSVSNGVRLNTATFHFISLCLFLSLKFLAPAKFCLRICVPYKLFVSNLFRLITATFVFVGLFFFPL